ncbi:MAG TPA: baseplate J/gp47 family protein, partial [Ktedonobacteraceae bacterium]
LLIFSTVLSTILIIFFTATATLTISLTKKQVSLQQTLTIPAIHTFPNIIKTLSQTALATGSGHQDATYATGLVTFFNALPSPQEVPQGQLLIGTDGTHIVTNQDAFIPAGTLSVNGQTTISAQVTTLGSQGNIQAGDISGACCRDYVFARNNQFSGGQDARNFTVVSQSDVTNLTQSLSSQINQQIQQDVAKQLSPIETITPPLCSQSIVPTPTVGQEANTVTVNITKTCSAASYTKADLTASVKHQFQQFVAMQFGSSFIPVGNPQVTISSTIVKENSVRITAFVQGTIVYHFRKADMDALKQRVAGKSKEQAGGIILKWYDLQLVGIQLQYNQDSLPSDPNKIKVRVKP